MNESKILWSNALGQLLIVVGIYVTLLSKSIYGMIMVGIGIISLIFYYTAKTRESKSDEMIKLISGKSSHFSFIVIFITLIILSIYWVYFPTVINMKAALLILITILIISKILYQIFWYSSIKRK